MPPRKTFLARLSRPSVETKFVKCSMSSTRTPMVEYLLLTLAGVPAAVAAALARANVSEMSS
jgi:hypothetical protein